MLFLKLSIFVNDEIQFSMVSADVLVTNWPASGIKSLSNLQSNLSYKPHQVTKRKCSSSGHAVVFAIEARC